MTSDINTLSRMIWKLHERIEELDEHLLDLMHYVDNLEKRVKKLEEKINV